jgi:hypothetical protein
MTDKFRFQIILNLAIMIDDLNIGSIKLTSPNISPDNILL